MRATRRTVLGWLLATLIVPPQLRDPYDEWEEFMEQVFAIPFAPSVLEKLMKDFKFNEERQVFEWRNGNL